MEKIDCVDFETVLSLRKYVSIASHVQGRIRFKASMGMIKDPVFKKLQKISEGEVNDVIERINGIIDTRLNLKAGSLVIQYDPEHIVPSDINTMIETKNDEIAKELLDKYMNKLFS